jgi:hypothetical protein
LAQRTTLPPMSPFSLAAKWVSPLIPLKVAALTSPFPLF